VLERKFQKINALDALLLMDDSIPNQDYFANYQVLVVLHALALMRFSIRTLFSGKNFSNALTSNQH
jgi:hypothetical protein